MSETTATHDVEFELQGEKGGFNIPPDLVPALRAFLESGQVAQIRGSTTVVGWLCPRCGAVNAPDVKRCECEPSAEDNRYYQLGPSETKDSRIARHVTDEMKDLLTNGI